jgi:hypothetical protein
VKTVHEALEEVDAVVEALKDRADEVLKMLGMELERDDWRDQHARGVAAPAVKAAAVGVATKATKTVAKSAATKVSSSSRPRRAWPNARPRRCTSGRPGSVAAPGALRHGRS